MNTSSSSYDQSDIFLITWLYGIYVNSYIYEGHWIDYIHGQLRQAVLVWA